MAKSIYEQLGGTYHEENGYLIPNATLLMAILRGVGIPCRLRGLEVSKDFQRGATNGIISALAPDRIIHTWVEVYYGCEWLALEGVITDKKYLNALKICQSFPWIGMVKPPLFKTRPSYMIMAYSIRQMNFLQSITKISAKSNLFYPILITTFICTNNTFFRLRCSD